MKKLSKRVVGIKLFHTFVDEKKGTIKLAIHWEWESFRFVI